jgi:hypothetical protein
MIRFTSAAFPTTAVRFATPIFRIYLHAAEVNINNTEAAAALNKITAL